MQEIETIRRASELAYVAGLLDGEGWVSIGCGKNGFREDGTQKYAFYIRVGICNTDARCLEKVTDVLEKHNIQFKVNIRFRGNEKHRPVGDILVYSQGQSIKFLELVYPYLTNKKCKAKQAMLFYDWLKKIKGGVGNNQYAHVRASKFDECTLKEFIERFREIAKWKPDLLKYSRKANRKIEIKRPSETTKPAPFEAKE